MKNFWGQDVTIGSTVGVGFRRSGSHYYQLGTVVSLEEKPLAWPKGETRWFAKVIWIGSNQTTGDRWTAPHTFQSIWAVRDLLLIDEASIDAGLRAALDQSYEGYIFGQPPSDFIPVSG